MINITQMLGNITASNSTIDTVMQETAKIFLPSILLYVIIMFLLVLLVGAIFIKSDKGNFWAIFIFTQLVGWIILFFIFIFPIIPQFLNKINFNFG